MKKRLKKLAKIFGFLLLAGITLVALWFAWVNWSGAREWKKTREMLVAEGIELDLQSYVPPMPPEDRNFARTPLIAAVTDFETGPRGYVYENPQLAERFREMRLPDLGRLSPSPSWKIGTPAKLDEVRKGIAAETGSDGNILVYFDQFEKELAEIDIAARLPENQIPVRMGNTFVDQISVGFPFVSDFREFQELQTIRACASLRVGNSHQARSALITSLQLRRTTMSHPDLGPFLGGLLMLDRSLSVIWEGLETNLWTVEDLKWIRDQLSTQEVLPQLENTIIFELFAFHIGGVNFMKSISGQDARRLLEARTEIDGEPPGHYDSLAWLTSIAPAGFWDHKLASGTSAMFEGIIQPVRQRRLPNPDLSKSRSEGRNMRNLHHLLDFGTESAFAKLISRSFESAISVDLARTACAVELYRIEHGDHPPAAEALVPAFIDEIPEDLFNPGNPLKYRKGAQDDRYRLYSVGRNGSDDHGEVEFLHSRHGARRDLEKGDWAWGYTFPGAEK